MLFNEELKKRYIFEKEQNTIISNGYLKRFFERVTKLEIELDKDVCNFTFYEIIEMYKIWNEYSLNMLQIYNSQLSLYTQWCFQQNLVIDSQNHFLEIKKEHLASCINTVVRDSKIMNRKQIVDLANKLVNPSDGFIILALYEGICGKGCCEFTDLKMSDFHVDEDGKIFVNLNTGRKIQVSNDLYNLALESNEEKLYYSVSGEKVVSFMPEDLIVKDYPNSTVRDNIRQRIASRIRRNMKEEGLTHINSNAIKESGKIDFIKRRSQEIGIDPKTFIIKHANEIEKQFASVIYSRTAFYDSYQKYLE